jgi:Electron transfer DM13
MQVIAPLRRHPKGTALVAVVVLGLGAFALWWFAPWNLFVDRRVDEALPVVGAPAAGGATAEGPGAAGATGGEAPEAEPVTLAEGGFASREHATSGTALVVELEDGSRFLRLQDLETSNGPDLRVILSDQPPSDDWHVWDDGRYVDLGGLKGNLGSSNYEIPADVDLDDFETAVIWCRRFSVGFGVAPLDPVR